MFQLVRRLSRIYSPSRRTDKISKADRLEAPTRAGRQLGERTGSRDLTPSPFPKMEGEEEWVLGSAGLGDRVHYHRRQGGGICGLVDRAVLLLRVGDGYHRYSCGPEITAESEIKAKMFHVKHFRLWFAFR
jgi:hypothetical protein